MCKVGDIILVQECKDNCIELGKHSFIVLSDVAGEIQGVAYDIICNVLSSFKNDEQKKKKLSYAGNFPITCCDSKIKNGNKLDGYIKSEQFYYFNKEKLDYMVLGQISSDVLASLMTFIQNLDIPFKAITENL
ncbi:hypothetical protein [Clostridium tagluense]|uniref:Uncharacterized protein n=1 Tax=Clostridium tagluense TaxID=360422 RepID=A0A401ULP0_9CLOT|nr:hypothetical protein [Clostridium tagluense]GCD10445.1 hypothetical protein Ctaglu_20680 [Clostridium tagluense]